MKLTLETTINNGAAFAHWGNSISEIIETAITEGKLTDTPLHADSHGVSAPAPSDANAPATPREDIDLATRVEDGIRRSRSA